MPLEVDSALHQKDERARPGDLLTKWCFFTLLAIKCLMLQSVKSDSFACCLTTLCQLQRPVWGKQPKQLTAFKIIIQKLLKKVWDPPEISIWEPLNESEVLRLGVASILQLSGVYLIQATSATSIRRHREASGWSGSTSAETGSTQDARVAWHVAPTWWIGRATAPSACSHILSPTEHCAYLPVPKKGRTREIKNVKEMENIEHRQQERYCRNTVNKK
jgi:hypothetical protein